MPKKPDGQSNTVRSEAIEADARSFTFIDAGPGRKSWFSFVLEDGTQAVIRINSVQAALAIEQLAMHVARTIRDQ